MSSLFREKSLEKLSDPEQLDQLFSVTSPRSWLALIAIFALIVVTIIWGIFGSIPVRVTGQGVILNRGQNIHDAVATETSWIKEILVSPGDHIEKGQVVAYMDVPLLSDQVEQRRIHVQQLREEHEKLWSFIAEDNQNEQKRSAELRQGLEKALADTRQHLAYQEEAIAKRQAVVKSGVISEQAMADFIRDYQRTKQDIKTLEQKIIDNKLEEQRVLQNNNDKLVTSSIKLAAEERELNSLQLKLKLASVITSPITGTVVELRTKPGTMVNPGQIIADITGNADILDAVVFVPAEQGKQIMRGMSAQITPSIIKKEEYGAIRGKVTDVSNFPSTEEGMLTIINNRKLVETFMRTGVPINLRVDMLEDPKTYSGYSWTSSKGPSLKLSSGTLCTVEITIRTQAPISLVIPALKRFFGLV